MLAVAALGLWLLLPGGALRAQDAAIEYAENGKDPVATFTAVDPEGATPITWLLAEAAVTDVVTADDVADFSHFDINKDGELTFDIGGDTDDPDASVSADYEVPRGTGPISDTNINTYKVVVTASDAETDGMLAYHKVTVKVTDVEEDGEVSWTVDADGTNGGPDTLKLTQFQVNASLQASVTDGDLEGTSSDRTDKTVVASGHDDVAADPTWRWYRSPSKTSAGTMIDGATSDTYPVTLDDVGMYLRAVAYYLVTGNVSQESASLTSDYRVLATRVGDNELEFDPAEVERSVAEGDKGANVGAPVRATGNHGAVNYALTGADEAMFEIDQKTGQIKTAVDLDYEGEAAATADALGSCADAEADSPDTECTVTVTATDASGDDSDPVATVTIKITNVDEKPTFTEDADTAASPKAIKSPEKETALYATGRATDDGFVNSAPGVTYAATDPESRNVTYHLMGSDGAKFQLSGDGVLSFRQKPNYEMPADRDRDNVYEVTVRASDGTLHEDRMVSVTVTNVDEEPEISGKESLTYAEGGTAVISTFTAVDPEGATPITWLLAEAAVTDVVTADDVADFSHFDINKDGELTFDIGGDTDDPDASVSADYEAPRGVAVPGDTTAEDANTYRVVVTAADSGEADANTAHHKVTVNVTDVAENGEVTWTVDADGTNGPDTPKPLQFQVGATLDASATDGDIASTNKAVVTGNAVTGDPVWEWYRGSTLIDDAEANEYTVALEDVGKSLRVRVTYTVEGNVSQESASLTSDYRVLATRVGDNELEFDPAEVERSVAEGDKGANVGAPVRATGNHGAVNYALTGADEAMFEIDQKTGQIKTAVDLDYEGEAAATADALGSCADAEADSPDTECTVTVTATDASGDDSDPVATVTIKITNVDEKPTFTEDADTAASPKAIKSPEKDTALYATDRATDDGFVNSAPGVTYAATDPEGLNVNLTLMGPDGAKFQLSGDGVLSFKAKPDYEMQTDAGRDNVYEVTVRASDGTLHEDRMVKVTVTPVDEAPEITVTVDGVRISGDSRASVAEGDTAVATYTARGENAARARWTLEGADAGDFRVSPTSGASVMLMFRSSPDYEAPADADTDNVYMVTLKATAAGEMDTHAVTVTVTDVVEDVPVIGGTLLDRHIGNDRTVSKTEVIAAFREYVTAAGSIDKSEIIDVYRQYIRDNA